MRIVRLALILLVLIVAAYAGADFILTYFARDASRLLG